MWKKIKETLGLNKAELAEAKALAASEARTKRAEAKAEAKAEKAKVKVVSAKDEAMKRGYYYSPRLHVDLWGNSWGK